LNTLPVLPTPNNFISRKEGLDISQGEMPLNRSLIFGNRKNRIPFPSTPWIWIGSQGIGNVLSAGRDASCRETQRTPPCWHFKKLRTVAWLFSQSFAMLP